MNRYRVMIARSVESYSRGNQGCAAMEGEGQLYMGLPQEQPLAGDGDESRDLRNQASVGVKKEDRGPGGSPGTPGVPTGLPGQPHHAL